MSTADTDTVREVKFALGTFTGVLVLAVGFAVYVLTVSLGLREGQAYLPAALSASLPQPLNGFNWMMVIGIAVAGAGVATRVYRQNLAEDVQWYARIAGTLLVVAGAAIASFGISPQTTTSAPFLAAAEVPKLVIPFLLGLLVLASGLLSLRGREHGVVTRGQKRLVVWVGTLLIAFSLLPSIGYVIGLLPIPYIGALPYLDWVSAGLTGPEAAAVTSWYPLTDGMVLDGPGQKVLLLAFSFTFLFAGYAVMKSSANAVGW